MKKKHLLILGSSYAAIILFTIVAILIAGKYYYTYLPVPYENYRANIMISDESVIEQTDLHNVGDSVKITFHSLKAGSTSVQATFINPQSEKESTTVYYEFHVLPTGVIFVSGYDFGGFLFVVLGITLMNVVSFAFCFMQLGKRRRQQFFSYKTVLDLALMIFFWMQSVLYFVLFHHCVLSPEQADAWQVANIAGFVMSIVFLLSLPLLVLFAGFLCASNLALIRHEGLRKNNLFGILISAMLVAGAGACILLTVLYPNTTGISGMEVQGALIRTVISSGFVYGECLLLAASLCTQYAATFKPKYNQDFIIILGCKIRADGTPLPLLQGRIDRALDFYRQQLEHSGKQACFIPSGGQGSDEVISEAESMKRYLMEQGIDESLIFPETRSTTTLENMCFSKEIADAHKKDANILFSTTNYHIFRSGIFSAKAGMRASGIGAKTKWYFWPNAQMREFLGLLAEEWKINLLFIFFAVALSSLFANLPTIVNFLVR
ncbi:MAG: YdcF family protein [Clostridia bacterium]|nr:YdcF family protein [Clostridia bacterium]